MVHNSNQFIDSATINPPTMIENQANNLRANMKNASLIVIGL